MTERTGYRIIEHAPRLDGEHLRAIHEVRYDEHGNLAGFIGIPVEILWTVDKGNEAGLVLFGRIREAFALPVLHRSDFPLDPPVKESA